MSDTFLFLGGSLDGQRLAMPNPGLPFRVPHPHAPTETYHAAKIAGSTRTFTVYAIDGWNGDDVIARLVVGASI